MKVNWELHPWQCEASTTHVFPLSDGFAGNPIFSNIFFALFVFRENFKFSKEKENQRENQKCLVHRFLFIYYYKGKKT